MIKLGELLKLLNRNDLTIGVYARVAPCNARRIPTDQLPNYKNREVTSVSFDAVGYEDCNPDLYAYVNIEGPFIPSDNEERAVYLD